MLEIALPAGPVLHTTRLSLRPLLAGDAAHFHRLINDWEICRRLPDAPFPYPAELAAGWIEAAAADRAARRAEQFALVDAATGALLGVAGLRLGGAEDRRPGLLAGPRALGPGIRAGGGAAAVEWAFAALPISHAPPRWRRITRARPPAAAPGVRAGRQERAGFMCRPGQKLPVQHFTLLRERARRGGGGALACCWWWRWR